MTVPILRENTAPRHLARGGILFLAGLSAIALPFVVDLHVRATGAGDDGLRLLFAVLGLSLDKRDRRRVVAGLRVGPVRPGHAFLRREITSGVVCPERRMSVSIMFCCSS